MTSDDQRQLVRGPPDIGSIAGSDTIPTQPPPDDFAPSPSPFSVRHILDFVAKRYGVEYAEIIGDNRTYRHIAPRHVGMYVAAKLTGKSSRQIGNVFRRDNSTVLYACRKVDSLVRSRADVANEIEAIKKSLQREEHPQ